MQQGNRRLTQRARVAQACEYCRKSKVKVRSLNWVTTLSFAVTNEHAQCDGVRPTCKRCLDGNLVCVYATSENDKRLVRHERRKQVSPVMATNFCANFRTRTTVALQDRVRELEAQLSASKRKPQSLSSHSSASPHDMLHVSLGVDRVPIESTADSLAAGHLDQSPTLDVGYFGMSHPCVGL